MMKETVKECMLMNVEISERCRHFSGILDPLHDGHLTRVFVVLIDEETGKSLEQLGWTYGVRRDFRVNNDSPATDALMIKIDYDICQPTVEIVTGSQKTRLDETQIGCLDSIDIDFANITIIQSGMFNENGKRIWNQPILKELKAYSLEE